MVLSAAILVWAMLLNQVKLGFMFTFDVFIPWSPKISKSFNPEETKKKQRKKSISVGKWLLLGCPRKLVKGE